MALLASEAPYDLQNQIPYVIIVTAFKRSRSPLTVHVINFSFPNSSLSLYLRVSLSLFEVTAKACLRKAFSWLVRTWLQIHPSCTNRLGYYSVLRCALEFKVMCMN